MKRTQLFTWLAGLAVMALGCQAEVIGGGGGTAGGGAGGGTTATGTSTVTGTSTGSNPDPTGMGGSVQQPPPGDGEAIAMLYSELPPIDNSNTGTSVGAAGGPTIDPSTLEIFLSNVSQSCADPFTSIGGCVERHQVSIQLPPNLQAPGTYPLQDLGFVSGSQPGNPGECAGGGGSYWDGTIQVLSIDPTQVVFTLAGTADYFFEPGNADGTYTAKRCF